jgi:hypothetical protein
MTRFAPALRAVAVIGVLARLSIFCAPLARGASDVTPGVQKIELELPGLPQSIHGVQQPRLYNEAGSTSAEGPQQVILRLQDGVSVSVPSILTNIIVGFGRTWDVEVCPEMKPVPYSRLRTDMINLLTSMGIDLANLSYPLPSWGDTPPPLEGGVTIPIRPKVMTPFHGLWIGLDINGNPQGWYYSIDFSVLGPGSANCVLPSVSPASTEGRSVQRISVNLPAAATTVRGIDVQAKDHGFQEVDLPQQQEISVRSLDGVTDTLEAACSSLFCFDGTVRAVFIRQPMKPEPFAQTMDDIRRQLSSLKIEPDRLSKMQSGMDDWDAQSRRNDPKEWYLTGTNDPIRGRLGFEPTSAHVGVRLLRDKSGDWYYYIIFYAP